MVMNGHRWLDIKRYTLFELGIVHRSCTHSSKVKERKEASQTLLFNWVGTHLDNIAVNKLLKEINSDDFYKPEEKKDQPVKGEKKQESEQLRNIRKLMSVMKGKQ